METVGDNRQHRRQYLCYLSATPGKSAAGASRAVTQGQQGNSSQTETVSFATRAADNFRYLLFFIVYLVVSFIFFIFAAVLNFDFLRNGTRLVTVSLAPIVQTLDSATHRINHYPADILFRWIVINH